MRESHRELGSLQKEIFFPRSFVTTDPRKVKNRTKLMWSAPSHHRTERPRRGALEEACAEGANVVGADLGAVAGEWTGVPGAPGDDAARERGWVRYQMPQDGSDRLIMPNTCPNQLGARRCA